MNIKKSVPLLALEASSPQELSAHLTEAIRGQGVKPRAAAVSIDEPQVMICPFRLDSGAVRDLEHHLISEAVEIMSLTPDEIVLDFQITSSDQKTVQGLYMCIPKNLFEEYLDVLDRKYCNPVKVTERFLASVDWLYQQGKLQDRRICFLDCVRADAIHVFIGNRGECELLRKIPYGDLDEARKEIIQSLRSASAKSSVKHYDHVYCYGGFDGMENLKSALRGIFHAEIEDLAAVDRKAALIDGRAYFSLNLVRKYNFSPGQLRLIQAGANILIALCVMISALMGLQMIKKNAEVNRVKEYYKNAEYQHAVELRNNLKK
jgi:hypothetical protein